MPSDTELRAAELAAVVQEVKERVRARYAGAGVSGLALPELGAVLHARDTAQGKVAAIGTVNPRAGGPLNALAQAMKRLVARAMDWHVREQVEYNRAVIVALDALLDALNENNCALSALAGQDRELRESIRAASDLAQAAMDATRPIAEEAARRAAETNRRLDEVARDLSEKFGDLGKHWSEWRAGWEQRRADAEIHFLRSLVEMQAAGDQRIAGIEAVFNARIAQAAIDIQKRFWDELAVVRAEYERLIHSELRVLRQRAEAAPKPAAGAEAVPTAATPGPPQDWFDALAFAERFRGSEESVQQRQQLYLPWFASCGEVLDIGCGRGEFLELMKAEGRKARGIDLSGECVALCRARGLDAEVADLYSYLAELPGSALDGVISAQVVEHLPTERLPEMIRLLGQKMVRGGRIALETPNPACLAIFATHFYLDPTHVRPVPSQLLAFYLQEAGFGEIRVEELAPAVESIPSVAELPTGFREAFFGGLDYAIFAKKL